MILKTALDFHSLYLKKLIASICVKMFSITVWWCTTGCVTELVLYFQLSVKGLVMTNCHHPFSRIFLVLLSFAVMDIVKTEPACNTWSSFYIQ